MGASLAGAAPSGEGPYVRRVLEREALHEWVDSLGRMTVADRTLLPGVNASRAPQLLAGALALQPLLGVGLQLRGARRQLLQPAPEPAHLLGVDEVLPQVAGQREHGLHHLARICHDYEAERDALVAQGREVAFEGTVGGSRTCWIDTMATLGFMVELLEPSDARDGWFAHMRKAAERWDGGDRIVGRPAADR